MDNKLQIQIVQNLVPVLTANVTIGGGKNITFGDTMTGTGTPADPINVSNTVLQQISDNAEQGAENASQISDIQNTLFNVQDDIQNATEQISDIQSVIPATANPANPLVDQGFVNSSIQTATAYFRGDWATWADVPSDPALYPADATGNHTPITNDYMVVIADEKTNGGTWRYKYTGVWAEQGKAGWLEEYQVNETPFTAAQNAALNSGVTAQAVANIATNKSNITALQNGKQDKLTAGDGITIDGNTISASGGVSGDYLPLSGGTLTGSIFFKSGPYEYEFRPNAFGSLTFAINGVKIADFEDNTGFLPDRNDAFSLGRATRIWKNVYTRKLNNGADLTVPTEAGTIARIEDIDAAVGDISTALTAILGE